MTMSDLMSKWADGDPRFCGFCPWKDGSKPVQMDMWAPPRTHIVRIWVSTLELRAHISVFLRRIPFLECPNYYRYRSKPFYGAMWQTVAFAGDSGFWSLCFNMFRVLWKPLGSRKAIFAWIRRGQLMRFHLSSKCTLDCVMFSWFPI